MRCTVPQQERIQGDRFIEMCDIRYEFGVQIPNEDGKTYCIFCKTETDLVFSLLDEIRKNPQSEYIIITHESDQGITEELANNIPSNVKRWFGQNIECELDKVESVPIGSISTTWIGEKQFACNTEYVDGLNPIHQYVKIPETGEEKNFINLVYMNFAIRTNESHRRPIYNHFKDMDWVTERECDLPVNEYANSSNYISTKDYYEELYNHKFTISPLGNGVDCGRVWQAICVGTIPIIPNHRNLDFYRELPILVYDDINEITESYLNDKWEEMSDKEYDLSKATVSYWRKRIEDEKCK